jgi:hypothetical protein
MKDKTLLYLTTGQLALYTASGGRMTAGPVFANDEEGYAAFASHLASAGKSLIYLLADLVEEDFHLETIPFVRGSDRRALIERRLAQRYRDAGMSAAISLGTEKTERRNERLLLSAITNTSILQPWLNIIGRAALPFAGVFSPALLSADLTRLMRVKSANVLIVSHQKAGLRQTLVQEGRIRFSRLGPIEAEDANQPERLPGIFASETQRIQQYLTGARILAREGPALEAILLAPPGTRERVAAGVDDTPQVRYRIIDIDETARAVGMGAWPRQSEAEAIFLHLLSRRAPKTQYAAAPLRHRFRLWQLRRAMVAVGAAVFAGCAAALALDLVSINALHGQIQLQQALAHKMSVDYEREARGFPKIPTSPENLRVIINGLKTLEQMQTRPDRILMVLSRVLDAAPAIELDQIRWDSAAGRSTPRHTPVNASSGPSAASSPLRYDTLELSARVTGVSNADYRGIAQVVNRFVDALRQQPGVEIFRQKLPFDLGSETTLSGDINMTSADAQAQTKDQSEASAPSAAINTAAPVFQLSFGLRTAP